MNQMYTKRVIARAAVTVGFAFAAASAAAQTAETTATAAPLATTTAVKKQPAAEATPEMIAEAIQRSKARTEKLNTMGKLERFGSEEPFTYDPTK
jgi:hypothetical protein